jgi:hypothetical protein
MKGNQSSNLGQPELNSHCLSPRQPLSPGHADYRLRGGRVKDALQAPTASARPAALLLDPASRSHQPAGQLPHAPESATSQRNPRSFPLDPARFLG